MDRIIGLIVLVITVAIIAVIVSERSNTDDFIRDAGSFFSGLVSAVTRPINRSVF